MTYLLDTCVLSELVSRWPNPDVLAWVDMADETRLYLSAITIGEIGRGVARLPNSARRDQLKNWLEQELIPRFANRILPLDTSVMITWGRLVAELERGGRTLPAMDSLIAALARYHNLQLVTRNERDFADTKVPLVNPWKTRAT